MMAEALVSCPANSRFKLVSCTDMYTHVQIHTHPHWHKDIQVDMHNGVETGETGKRWPT